MIWQAAKAPASRHRFFGDALPLLRRALFLTLALLLGMVIVSGCGRAEQGATETKDDYTVTFATEPASPVIGQGRVTVTIKDKGGQGVEAANIALEANMSHAGMTPVLAEITTGAGGVYTTPLEWTMGGAWYVDAKITLPGGEVIRRRFPLDVK